MWTKIVCALPVVSLLALAACSGADDRSSDDNDSEAALRRNSHFCGGIAGIQCPSGERCELAGNYPDASGTCKKIKAGEEDGFCGGIAGIQCKAGLHCEFDNSGNSMPPGAMGMPVFDQSGTCKRDAQQLECGGFAGIQCPAGKSCVDDPNDSCDPANGGADCGGICIDEAVPVVCGGFAGIQCPAGLTCVDDPNDGCDPQNGGADCGGICVAHHGPPPGTMGMPIHH